MRNPTSAPRPWSSIPLTDYEGHMGAAHVGQAALLGDVLAALVDRLRPASLAILGAAGGNGLERVEPCLVRRVVAVDINPQYLAACVERHGRRFETLIAAGDDIAAGRPSFAPVELVYAGLIAEYVPVAQFAAYARAATQAQGTLAVVLQLPGEAGQIVTPSAYASLGQLAAVFQYVKPDELTALLRLHGFHESCRSTRQTSAGKQFAVLEFRAGDVAAC